MYAAFTLLLVTCGGTAQPTPAPTPDIEAIVQARLMEERAVVATVEAKVQSMVKAIIAATVDIEAIVQARLEEERAAVATVRAEAQSTAKTTDR